MAQQSTTTNRPPEETSRREFLKKGTVTVGATAVAANLGLTSGA